MRRFRMLLIGLIVIMIAGCAGNPDLPQALPTSTPIPTAPAAARPIYVVQRGMVEEVFEFTGRWLPRDQSALWFEIGGIIRRVEVLRGDSVRAGQLLADLQITELENQLAAAQLELEGARAALQSGSAGTVLSAGDAEIALANARLRLLEAQAGSPWSEVSAARLSVQAAEREVEACQRAYDDALSRPDQPASAVDNARNALDSARERLLQARNSLNAAGQRFSTHQFGIAEAENAVIAAEIALENERLGIGIDPAREQAVRAAQLRIDQLNASIRQSSLDSPIDGEVLEVSIQPGDTAEAFSPVIVVGSPQPREIITTLALADAQRLSIGQTGRCHVANQPETAVQCIVRLVPLSARDADQTTRVAASLQLTTPNLPNGQIIEVFMPLHIREGVLWLPPNAIRTFQNRTFVVLQTPDGPRAVDVQVGLRTADRVELISGVNEGDIVEAP